MGRPIDAIAEPGPIAILHHERVAELRMRGSADLQTRAASRLGGQAKPTLPPADMTFAAFGRDFQLVLEPNTGLIGGLSAQRRERLDSIELYRGRVLNAEGSWARIARAGTAISGLIFDGVEYFAIDSLEDVADKLLRPEGAAQATVIYRLHDTTGLIHDHVLAPSALPDGGPAAQKVSILPNVMSAVVLGQQIDIGVVGDVEFTQLVGASKADKSMIQLINIVDGIFLEGLGVHINLVELHSYDAEPDPFGSSSPTQLLGHLEVLKQNEAAFSPLGLLHLFTGRDLDDSSSSAQTLGVANLASLCHPRFSVSLTQSRGGSAIDALVAAHEIGHNFGAPHDAQPGSACAAAPAGMLMDANIGGSTEFSQCSIDQMQIEIAAAMCMTPLLPANVTLSLLSSAPPSIVRPDVAFEFDIAVENTSGVDAVDVKLVFDAPSMHVGFANPSEAVPDECDVRVVGRPFTCYWSELSNGERFETTVHFRATKPGEPATIDVNLTSLTESDSTGDSLHFDVDVLPYVNLAASLDPTALSLRPDQPGSVSATIRNNGTETATQVVAHIRVGSKLELMGGSLSQCSFVGNTLSPGYDCSVGTLAPGASRELVVDFRPRPNLSAPEIKTGANLNVWASSLEPERTLDAHDNFVSTRVTLGDSIGDLVIDSFALPSAMLGATIIVVFDVRNDGPDTIHDVVVEFEGLLGSAQPQFATLSTTSASCRLPLAEGDAICEIAQLAPDEEVNLEFAITATTTGTVHFAVTADMSSSDPNSSNNGSSASVNVFPQPPPPPAPAPSPAPTQPSGGGGGGGAVDPWALALLGFLLVSRGFARRSSRPSRTRGRRWQPCSPRSATTAL